uniref:Uncharacterized protein n=1 Tax=Romanomermis culicivorax TaxID=13658 RepID=A0A915HWQ8_ROMCU
MEKEANAPIIRNNKEDNQDPPYPFFTVYKFSGEKGGGQFVVGKSRALALSSFLQFLRLLLAEKQLISIQICKLKRKHNTRHSSLTFFGQEVKLYPATFMVKKSKLFHFRNRFPQILRNY